MSPKVYVQVRSIELGSYTSSNVSDLILNIGTKKLSLGTQHLFKSTQRNNFDHTWEFTVDNQNSSSFYIVLYEHHPREDKFVGAIYLAISGFQPNSVVTEKFELHSDSKMLNPPTIWISVHVDMDNSQPFDAPDGFLF
ncbi:hypothetical protein TVAG_188430 [Trichomonas vaginalis G3]|uniref:C2 domain-containing protein n=1 Tax=Trichomonas vaginalis (strain ATCC PRA-98 / G3) TaxID=412133 RepID=A2G2L8_TRIV3|nr:C2 domain-containing protein [Trichomonas vaginalis G3]EAX88603.1 hypothetical protein TVAG_188430 [Trichomonas vaginalis G3]KAI5531297.1 C2 domain-containing protein [Trichomonas vaginalis G3]|eukprot:XP_001301533.1 hypothetical protein [Trichomonas vaginalis G3]